MLRAYAAGQLWSLTLTPDQRRLATVLSDLIIPADEISPSASAVGTGNSIDEWISAPYVLQQRDRTIVLNGFNWLDRESRRRISKNFADLEEARLHIICADICNIAKASSHFVPCCEVLLPVPRRLLHYADGRKDLGYVGNTPLTSFAGPPFEVLKKVG